MENFDSFICSEDANEPLYDKKNFQGADMARKKAVLDQLIEKGRKNHDLKEQQRQQIGQPIERTCDDRISKYTKNVMTSGASKLLLLDQKGDAPEELKPKPD